MMRRQIHTTMVVILALSIGSSVAFALPSDYCGTYFFSEKAKTDLIGSHYSSVLRVLVGRPDGQELKAKGTGFLIDSANGFIVTARHVVQNVIDDSDLQIFASTLYSPTEKYRLNLLTEPSDIVKNLDVAILQLDNREALRDVKAFELSFQAPEPYSTVTFLGYQLGDTAPLAEEGLVLFFGGKLQLRANTFSGDSGSPVFNMKGLVIGVVTDKRLGNATVVAPMLRMLQAFRRLSPGSKPFLDLIGKSGDSNKIRRFLNPQFQNEHVSNFELLGVFDTVGRAALTSPLIKSIHCPLFIAGVHREMGAALSLLFPRLSAAASGDAGQVQVRVATALAHLGQSDRAIETFVEAEAFLSTAVRQRINAKPVLISVAFCAFSLGEKPSPEDIGRTRMAFEAVGVALPERINVPQNCGALIPDVRLASLLRDLTLSRYGKHTLKDPGTVLSDPALQSGAVLASLYSPAGEVFGANLALLGNTLILNQNYVMASKAFAGAWQNGMKVDWVSNNFHFVVRKMPGMSVEAAVDIGSFRALERGRLLSIIGEGYEG